MEPPPPPPPELMEELVEEIILRFPPDDPASLVRAALVCKPWCRFVCGAGFRRRFREFHRSAAPLLGVIYNGSSDVRPDRTPRDTNNRHATINFVYITRVPMAYFVPTTSFRPAHAADGRYHWRAIDVRHGRVLLYRKDAQLRDGHGDLCVWDPVTDEQRDLPEPPFTFNLRIGAVACAASAGGDCDHLNCCGGPFLVAVMDVQYDGMHLSVYSSKAGAWSKVTVCDRPTANFLYVRVFNQVPGVLAGSALYILLQFHCYPAAEGTHHEIVNYNLATRQLSMIQLPSKFCRWKPSIVVMTDDDGELGFVANVNDKLQLWSRVAGADGDAGFVLSRVIDLPKLLPSSALRNKPNVNYFAFIKKPQVYCFADGGASRVLFIRAFDGVYSIDMNSSLVKKLANCCGDDDVVPYISFCTPTSRVLVQEYNT